MTPPAALPPETPGQRVTLDQYVGTLVVPVERLHDYPGNPRIHDDARLDRIVTGLGQTKSVSARPHPTVEGEYELFGGHGFRDACTRNGVTEVLVEVFDLTDAQAVAAVAALNGATDNAGYEAASLLRLLQDADYAGLLAGTGYGQGDVDDLLARAEEEAAPLLAGASAEAAVLAAAGAAPVTVGPAPAPAMVADLPHLYGDGPSDAGDSGVRSTPTMASYADRYAEKITRAVVMDFPNVQFAWVIERLAALRAEFDVETNADVLLRLIGERSGDVPPAAE